MRTVGLRVVVAISAFMFGVVLDAFVNTSTLVEKALAYPVKAIHSAISHQVEIPQRRVPFNPSLPTEITFERIQPACFGCPVKRIQMRAEAVFEDAVVTEIETHTGATRHGKLDSYFYRNLMAFILAQGYFEMNQRYSATRARASDVVSSVSIGESYKSIRINEVDAPPALWGIHYAIEGVLQHVSWEN